jgi:hypothetical protein
MVFEMILSNKIEKSKKLAVLLCESIGLEVLLGNTIAGRPFTKRIIDLNQSEP